LNLLNYLNLPQMCVTRMCKRGRKFKFWLIFSIYVINNDWIHVLIHTFINIITRMRWKYQRKENIIFKRLRMFGNLSTNRTNSINDGCRRLSLNVYTTRRVEGLRRHYGKIIRLRRHRNFVLRSRKRFWSWRL